MSFIKFVSPRDYFKDEPPLSPIKFARERRQFYTDKLAFDKRAGCVFSYEEIIKTAKPGEYLVHVIALGCDEVYGPNRNGDTFTTETCRRAHQTFKKYARVYREHEHNNPERSYGIVKASAFNEKEGRIELILALNGTKEAARRNGGLVADKEIDLLESGRDMPVSMACKVAYDVCSGCGNKARNRSEYCTGSTCKYGGLRDNIGKTFDDGHTLRAFNPDPKFFDISHVYRPADRIAYSLGTIKSGSLAWLYPLPSEQEVKRQLQTLAVLGYLENRQETNIKHASRFSSKVYRMPEIVPHLLDYDIPESTYLLTKSALLLPVEDFLKWVGVKDDGNLAKMARAVRSHMPGIFNSLSKQADILDLVKYNFFYPRRPDWVDFKLQEVLDKTATEKSIVGPLPGCDSGEIKFATYNIREDIPAARGLAETYALYQLASLSEWTNNQELAIRNTIILNRIL